MVLTHGSIFGVVPLSPLRRLIVSSWEIVGLIKSSNGFGNPPGSINIRYSFGYRFKTSLVLAIF